MAYNRTKVLLLLFINLISKNCGDIENVRPPKYDQEDIRISDPLLRSAGERYEDNEDNLNIPHLSVNRNGDTAHLDYDDLDHKHGGNDYESDIHIPTKRIDKKDYSAKYPSIETTTNVLTTTSALDDISENNRFRNLRWNRNNESEDDIIVNSANRNKTDQSDDEMTTPTESTEPVTDGYTVDNSVYKLRDSVPDEVYNTNNDVTSKSELSATQSTTEEVEAALPRPQDPKDDTEIGAQRNPKTENSSTKQPIDKRQNDVKPPPPVAVSKSSTLKGWLEDVWLRPPAGILVPLRPMALNRALAVWNDLIAVEGLNVSDIVIVGYDTNGVSWRSRHNLHGSSTGQSNKAVSEALSKLLLKYQGVHTDPTNDGTMRALASAAKLVPYDSALFVLTDKAPGDPQRLPLALRALVEKRLKVYTVWTDPDHPSADSEIALQSLKNISTHTEGDVLPYSLQVMDIEDPVEPAELQQWRPLDLKQARKAKLYQAKENNYDTVLVRRGGGSAMTQGVPVENGVTALRIYIEGAVEHAVLYPPNDAPLIDLYNETSVRAFSPGSRIDGQSPRDILLVFPGVNFDKEMLSVLPMPSSTDPPAATVGVWHFSVRCATCDYRLRVGARSLIHFDVSTYTDQLQLRVSGPVASVRESSLVDEYGTEQAKLPPFSYPPMAVTSTNNMALGIDTELALDVPLPNVKGSRIYAKIVGRDIRGEPFVRMSGPIDHPSEVRISRSASIVFPDPFNDLELAEEINSAVFNGRLQYNDTSILPSNRAASQVVNQQGTILTAVQIGLSSRLYGAPGANLQLHYEVSNYRNQAVTFNFVAVGELRFLRGISPSSQVIQAGQTANVIVSVGITATAQPGARDLITFTAYSGNSEQVSISTYVYVVNLEATVTDVWPPEVRHNFQGTCIGRLGSDCATYVWSATIIARDSVGGLLRLSSTPMGLMYDGNFISGTREEVIATYRATCCAPRVMVTAVDAYGNPNGYVVDISNYYTGAAIAAITLGVFLAIALIILIVFLIYWCVKRRKESRELPSSYVTSRNTRSIS